jgi:hypothetical protein
MKVHKQIFFLIFNTKKDLIEPENQEAFTKLFHLFKNHGFNTGKETSELIPNSKIGTIDVTNDIPQLSVASTVFLGYMFATAFKEKTLLTIQTVLEHFQELVIKKNSELLDRLYREAYITKFKVGSK